MGQRGRAHVRVLVSRGRDPGLYRVHALGLDGVPRQVGLSGYSGKGGAGDADADAILRAGGPPTISRAVFLFVPLSFPSYLCVPLLFDIAESFERCER